MFCMHTNHTNTNTRFLARTVSRRPGRLHPHQHAQHYPRHGVQLFEVQPAQNRSPQCTLRHLLRHALRPVRFLQESSTHHREEKRWWWIMRTWTKVVLGSRPVCPSVNKSSLGVKLPGVISSSNNSLPYFSSPFARERGG